MDAAVIAIGDEMTSGQRVDTNSAWLSQRLGELGIHVVVHATAADEIGPCTDVFRFAAGEAQLVICTGGLGPTADDLTRDALAAATDLPLELDHVVLAHIQQLFESRGRTMAEQNQRQAMFPAGSVVVPNPHGTAPGIDLTVATANGRQVRFIALPGVPVEMREMWSKTIEPQLAQTYAGGRVIAYHCIKCFGAGESQLESMLPDLIARGRDPRVGITVHRATITLRITSIAESQSACRLAMQSTIDEIHQRLGELVFGEGVDELQDTVVRALAARGKTIATLETSTQGLLAHWLAAADDANRSQAFAGGVICHSDNFARKLVDDSSADVASRAFVNRAAQRVRDELDADYGLALGGFSAEGPFVVGLATGQRVELFERSFAGHPDILIERSAKQGLDIVRLTLS